MHASGAVNSQTWLFDTLLLTTPWWCDGHRSDLMSFLRNSWLQTLDLFARLLFSPLLIAPRTSSVYPCFYLEVTLYYASCIICQSDSRPRLWPREEGVKAPKATSSSLTGSASWCLLPEFMINAHMNNQNAWISESASCHTIWQSYILIILYYHDRTRTCTASKP